MSKFSLFSEALVIPPQIITSGVSGKKFVLLPPRLYTQESAYKGHLYAVDFREWTYKSNLAPFASAPRTLCINHAHRELMERHAIKIWSCYPWITISYTRTINGCYPTQMYVRTFESIISPCDSSLRGNCTLKNYFRQLQINSAKRI